MALKIVPDDVPRSLHLHQPAKVYPDGNCFSRALSRIVYGEEWHFLEMRCRLVIELAVNCDLYLDNQYLMRRATHKYKCDNIAMQYCTYTPQYIPQRHKLDDISHVHSIFEEEVMALRRSGNYCGIWEFHAAANCLKKKIYGVYPHTPALQSIRQDHHRFFLPQQTTKSTHIVGIMWTRSSPNSCSFDHFVPLLKPVRYYTFMLEI
jgi:hypothetical protein